MHRWRTLPDDAPRLAMPLLWCLVASSSTAISVAAVALLTQHLTAARPELPWPEFVLGLSVPALGLSLWGMQFRRFAFGSAWIVATLAAGGILCTGFIGVVAASGRGKDSIGHGLAIIFGTPLLLIAVIVASSIAYAMYWRRQRIRIR